MDAIPSLLNVSLNVYYVFDYIRQEMSLWYRYIHDVAGVLTSRLNANNKQKEWLGSLHFSYNA